MPMPITVDKESEFFMSIAKEGIHSFIMLGVMVEGRPVLLARVGKGNLIDKNFGLHPLAQMTMFKKALFSHTDASLMDEGIGDSLNTDTISYQSYAIAYEQYKEFLLLAKEIQAQQLVHYQERIAAQPDKDYSKLSFPEKGVRKLKQGITCYVPTHEEDGTVTLNYQKIDSYGVTSPRSQEAERHHIIGETSNLHVSNTCRTTARSILNYILGYSPQVPALFAVGLDYNTKLVAGAPAANTFYILPPPPKSFNVTPAQSKALEELYKRLENIPKSDPTSPSTREKFDAIKKLYKEISGESTLSLSELLDKITIHRVEHNNLFDKHRGQGLASGFLKAIGAKTETQRVYDRMEQSVHAEIDRLKIDTPADEKYQSDERRPPTVSL